MLITLTIFGIILLALTLVLWNLGNCGWDLREKSAWRRWLHEYIYDASGGVACMVISIMIIIVGAVGAFGVGIEYSNHLVIDEKIEMYQEENQKIEQEIADIVYNYQQYEKDTFTTAKIDNINVALNMYPELKSDTLIEKQMTIYAENNKQIKYWRTKQLDYKVLKWWLFF